jgi:predicted permease
VLGIGTFLAAFFFHSKITMLRNHLVIAFRYFLKDRRSTLLNLLGLSTGLACAILIYIWVSDEMAMDNFHVHDARLFQVMENRVQASGIWTASSSTGPMADALAKDMPEVEYACSSIPARDVILSVNREKTVRSSGKYAGRDFFKMFSYALISGNADQVLADKNNIVLSDLLAVKLFGNLENIIGKTVIFQDQKAYRVSGVFRDPGIHSSDRFDFVLSDRVFKDENPWANEWGSTFCSTFILLKPGVDVAQFNRKIAGFVKLKSGDETSYRTPFITRYSETYLYGRYENGIRVGGRIDYVHLFSIIAVFILLIACINFVNLSTAKASERAKEVGIRKVVGAGRGTLVLQYFEESMLMALAALLLAIVLVFLLLPAFNDITGKQLRLTHPDMRLILSVTGISLFTGLVSGIYPALYLSGFRPVLVLKGKLRSAAGELFIRKALVIFQFTLSVALIIAVLVVYKQIRFIQTTNLGYDRDHLISFRKEGKLADGRQQEAFLTEVRKIPGVLQASSIGHNLLGHNGGTYGVTWEGKDPKDKTEFENMPVDFRMIETLGLKIVEGRSFSPAFGSEDRKIIFNEAAIKYMGMKDPVGKKINLWGRDMEIAGVVRDFHFQSLHEKVKPLFIWLAPENTRQFMVRIETGREKTVLGRLAILYRQFNPAFSFEYSFLDTDYQTLYVSENRISVLSRYFAGMAILISCLGLFGLAAFTARKRQKEIGIRKVVGASVRNIAVLLYGEFLRLVVIALLIAFPLAWWEMTKWLKSFAYRIPLHAGVFLIAGAFILLITTLTVGFQAIKAAVANPVNSLWSE